MLIAAAVVAEAIAPVAVVVASPKLVVEEPMFISILTMSFVFFKTRVAKIRESRRLDYVTC